MRRYRPVVLKVKVGCLVSVHDGDITLLKPADIAPARSTVQVCHFIVSFALAFGLLCCVPCSQILTLPALHICALSSKELSKQLRRRTPADAACILALITRRF